MYGYGTRTLGTASVVSDVTINGFQTISKPVEFKSNTAVSSLIMEGERLYISPTYPGGNGVNHGASRSFYGPIYPSTGFYAQWVPNGYKAYENTVQTGSVVHEMSWTVAGYPGSWY